jgi:iron complex outermembrane recepter protein
MKKKLLLTIAWICMAWGMQVSGQVVSGRVLTALGKPLSLARIHVLNSQAGAVSDSLGRYLVALPPGRQTVSVEAAGFATASWTISLHLATVIDVVLLPSGIQLDEVVITAHKVEERLIAAPGSVTSLSAAQVAATRTLEISNLSGIVPNYQYGNLGVRYQQQVAIRGISVFSEDPATATYIDGVNALDISANGWQLFDIDRIEVLRGPQGTLYGRNAMGGVINIVTQKPTNKTVGFAETSIGNQGLQRFGGGLRLPLIKDKLFLGISAQGQRQFGFYTNDLSDKLTFLHDSLKGTPEDGARMGDEDSYYGNLALKWIPNARNLLQFNFKAQQDRSVGASMYYQAVENDSLALERPYIVAVNDLGSNRRTVANGSVAWSHYFQNFTLNYTAAYQHVLQAYDHVDQDLWALDYASGSSFHKKVGDAYPQTVLSQELRLNSVEKGQRLSWTAGTYGFHQDYNKQYATIYKRLALLFGQTPGIEVSKTHLQNTGVAAFGQVSYKLHSRLTVTGGLRLDYEYRKTTNAKFRVQDDGSWDYLLQDTSLGKGYEALTPKVVVQYAIAANHHTYLSYARGFRAGGINMFTTLPGYQYFAPEYSDNFEIGYKAAGKSNRWVVTTALFLLQWHDLQLDVNPAVGVWVKDNIGDVRSIGAELEFSAKPIKGLQVDGSLGINRSRYLGFDYLGTEIKGNRTILAPNATAYMGLQQALPLSSTLGLVLRGELRHIGHQYFDLVNTIEQPAYQLLNGSLGLVTTRVSLSAWVQNILGATYITYAMPGYFKYTLLNRPRTMGITLKASF